MKNSKLLLLNFTNQFGKCQWTIPIWYKKGFLDIFTVMSNCYTDFPGNLRLYNAQQYAQKCDINNPHK